VAGWRGYDAMAAGTVRDLIQDGTAFEGHPDNIPAALLSNSIQIGGPTSSVFLQAADGGLPIVGVAGASGMSPANNPLVAAFLPHCSALAKPADCNRPEGRRPRLGWRGVGRNPDPGPGVVPGGDRVGAGREDHLREPRCDPHSVRYVFSVDNAEVDLEIPS